MLISIHTVSGRIEANLWAKERSRGSRKRVVKRVPGTSASPGLTTMKFLYTLGQCSDICKGDLVYLGSSFPDLEFCFPYGFFSFSQMLPAQNRNKELTEGLLRSKKKQLSRPSPIHPQHFGDQKCGPSPHAKQFPNYPDTRWVSRKLVSSILTLSTYLPADPTRQPSLHMPTTSPRLSPA